MDLELSRFSPVPRSISPEPVRILTVGRMIPRKGFSIPDPGTTASNPTCNL